MAGAAGLYPELEALPYSETKPAALEVCPLAISAVQEVSKRLQQVPGAALYIDYGQDGHYEDSLMVCIPPPVQELLRLICTHARIRRPFNITSSDIRCTCRANAISPRWWILRS